MFPIMYSYRFKEEVEELRAEHCIAMVIALPWPMMTAHEAQAKRNHDQTIERLAQRGGLSACETVAILEDRDYYQMSLAHAHSRLKSLFQEWQAAQRAASSAITNEA